MGSLAAYSIKSAILLSILFAIYMLTLGRKKWPSLRRFSLLGICLASLSLPLLYAYSMHIRPVATDMDLTLHTPTVNVSDNFTPLIFTVIAGIIASGICVSIVISIIGLIRIQTLRTTTAYSHGFKFKVIDNVQTSPFCFCGSIYISKEDLDDIPEMILTHETSHIGHLHFIDLFIGRILLILQWWNPLVWLFVREMQQVHEYQADNDVLNAGYDSKEYQYLLLNRAIGDTRYSFVSGFKHSELKKRLRMINRENSGRMKVIALLVIMLTSASFASFALRNSSIILFINEKLSAINIDSFRQTMVELEVKTLEGQPHVIVDGTDIPSESINSIDPSAIKSISVRKDQPEYPYGVIEIETKPGMNIHKTDDSPKTEETEGIKVIGYGMQKRNSN